MSWDFRGIIFSFGLGLSLLLLGCRKPPTALLQHAQVALDTAASAGALRYAEPTYRLAESVLNRGWMEMARQNGRFGPFRDYSLADSLLKRALELADSAANRTLRCVDSLSAHAHLESEQLQTELGNWREALDGSLALYTAEHFWTRADLDLKMCQSLIQEEEYGEALKAAGRSRASLMRVGEILADYANDEAQQLANWRRWVRETVAESQASGGHAVLVNKTAHKLYLLREGKIIHTYPCELGYNSARQKLFAGDGATPEGKYHVTSARSNGSRYYKALMLDYPNATDRRRFEENKRRGIISKRSGIGKNIEIHGAGGRNDDWTEGCVALTNEDITHLMKFVSAGTPVTIVRRSDQWP
jgi:L,D-peptidoglycan transpeptidase YkuD (ErfK/YbiS/YcfS/YnhG family)